MQIGKQSVQLLLNQMKQWPENISTGSAKVLGHIQNCRTARLGYHLYRCSDHHCGHMKSQYHSCRNRHCPMCGNCKKDEWIEARMKELLPCKYYHIVFTVPHELNSLIMGNRKILFKLMFDTSAYTLLKFSEDEKYIGAQSGITSVLHTWGQQLSFHPHIHSIVSGGGITPGHSWKEAQKSKHGILFPVKAMRIVYRARFMKCLQKLIDDNCISMTEKQKIYWLSLRDLLYKKEWIVYAKQPFGGPQQVIEYLGRYTHKVAISNHRIMNISENNEVSFQYKDYRDAGKKKTMTISGAEFIRRFTQHILPERFCKIRHYGFLGNNKRKTRIKITLQKMGVPVHAEGIKIGIEQRMREKYGLDILKCPCCKKSSLELLKVVYPKSFQYRE
jgi:hypothetical protein